MEGLGGGGAGEVVVDDRREAVLVDGVNGGVKGAFGVPVVGEPELRGAAKAEVAGAGGKGVREGGAGFGGGRWEEEKARNGVEEGAGGVVGDVGEEGVEGDDVDGVNGGASRVRRSKPTVFGSFCVNEKAIDSIRRLSHSAVSAITAFHTHFTAIPCPASS